MPGSDRAQIPTNPAQAQRLLRENPELARQQFLQSGMSEAEARSRLAAAGLPAQSLDAIFSAGPIAPGTALDPNAARALQVIGLTL